MDTKNLLILAALGAGAYFVLKPKAATGATSPATGATAYLPPYSPTTTQSAAGSGSWLTNVASGVHTAADIFGTIKGAIGSAPTKAPVTASVTAPIGGEQSPPYQMEYDDSIWRGPNYLQS